LKIGKWSTLEKVPYAAVYFPWKMLSCFCPGRMTQGQTEAMISHDPGLLVGPFWGDIGF
jgi:hypothetical protein